jgi:FMNH2-dependent dimethyl sulfone monooxygenase
MHLGIWTPLPHTLVPEPRMAAAITDATRLGQGEGPDKAVQLALDVVRTAEEHGFAITLIAARHLGPDLEAWTLAAALAMQTKQIEIMVAAHPGIFQPQMVAKMTASLDRISGGRAAVNVVNGWNVDEFQIYGNGAWLSNPDDRYLRMDEFIQVMRGLWVEDKFDFSGKFYQVTSGTLPLRSMRTPNPPIYTASRSDSGKLTTAKYGDYWFVPDRGDFRKARETEQLIRAEVSHMQQLSSQFGRELRFGLSANIVVGLSTEEAERRAERLEAYGRQARYNKSSIAGLGACLVGTPVTIAERIDAYEDMGVNLLLLQFHPMEQGLAHFISEVLPMTKAGKRMASFNRIA